MERDKESGDETKTHIVLKEKTAEVHKRGGTVVDFSFVPETWTKAEYKTEFGGILLQVFTKEYRMRERGAELTAEFSYEFRSDEGPGTICRIEIALQEKAP